ncbi:CATRA conflict system CASPASE/TPR repeat-associated protein [Streptomyces sp. NPDC101213]|uniref:CATRA conflict system CASPASE/TPR repeat-associated protein n=1 Tax=unclassified Streptomyces TaxID=2593676 RepID=UPI0036FF4EA1
MAFAPADSEIDNNSREYLASLWRACRSLGMTEPIPGVPVPADHIDFGSAGPAAASEFTLLAAAERTEGDALYSAFAFAEHDVVGVVALLAPNDTTRGLTRWSDLDARWNAAVAAAGGPSPSWGMLGEFRVFEALYDRGLGLGDSDLCDLVRRHAPRPGSESWWNGFDRTEHGFAVWRSDAAGGPEAVTDLYVLAPARQEDALDEWAWAVGGRHGLRPLARYLLQLSKIRYQHLRYAASGAAGASNAQTVESDERTTRLLRELEHTTRHPVPLERVLKASALLDEAQFGPQGLLWTITRQRQLSRGLSIAVANMRLHTPDTRRRGKGTSWTVTDLAEAEWLIRQVEEDRLHLEAVRERAEGVRTAVSTLVERELARHRGWLTLIQTSVLGAVLTALTAVQAMQYEVPMRKVLQSPAIAALSALALALPLAVLRLAGASPATRRYRWLDSGAAGLFGAALGWLAATAGGISGGGGPPTAAWTISAALVTGLTTLLGTYALTRPR